jgi:hypothetical protein
MPAASGHQPALNEGQQYWMALGRFIEQFSHIEMVMHLLLTKYSNVTHLVGVALFGDMRIDAAVSRMRRLLEVNFVVSDDIKKEFHNVSTQLMIINGIRNDILHRGTSVSSQGMVTTNRAAALALDRIKEIPISKEILYQMELDLHKIQHHIICIMDEKHRKNASQILASPWQYTHPSQEDQYPYRTMVMRAKSNKPPPRSSPA